MSVKRITIHAYRCKCELPDCPGGGKPWTSHGKKIPRACRWCKRITWNRPDRRLKPKTEDQRRAYNRKMQAASRARRKKAEKPLHWIFNSKIACGPRQNASVTTEKKDVTCRRCLNWMNKEKKPNDLQSRKTPVPNDTLVDATATR